MTLPQIARTFVLHFGEMGSRWGINRTVGQIYALLFLSSRPIPAEEIAEQLGFSRSNVSMGLKELESWRLVQVEHRPGDRREYYSTPKDIWTIVRTLAEERKRREVDPTLSMLRTVLLESPTSEEDRYAQARMGEMHDLIVLLTDWFDDVEGLDNDSLVQLLKLGSKIQKVLKLKRRMGLGGAPRR
jgi:DNA-binding transcriptional regulator GbsR (MarR family)